MQEYERSLLEDASGGAPSSPKLHWLLDLQHSAAAVAGRLAACCVSSLSETDEEELLSPWLKSSVFSGGLSAAASRALCPEVEAVKWSVVAAEPADAPATAASCVADVDKLGVKPLDASTTRDMLSLLDDGALVSCVALGKPFADPTHPGEASHMCCPLWTRSNSYGC